MFFLFFCGWLLFPLSGQTCPPPDTTAVNPLQNSWTIPYQNNWNGLEIMTWNVEQFPLSSNTLNYVNEIISDLLPDVINFQEITNLTVFNQLAASLSAYEFIHTDYAASGGYNMDLGMAVRRDCVSIEGYGTLFPGESYNFAGRFPLKANLTWGCGEAALSFQMICVHLKCCDDGFNRRLAATQLMRDYIYNQMMNQGQENIIVAGDFNDEINEPVQNNSLWPLVNDPDEVYFTTTPIVNDNNQQSFPWYWNPSFLDHVLISSGLFNENSIGTVQTLRIDDYTGSNTYRNNVSDHRPVIWRIPLTSIGIPTGLVINEIMNNPSAVSDSYGEWFELFNTGSETIDLNGLILRDDGTDQHTITQTGGLLLASGGYLVLGRNGDPALNGAVQTDYVYSNINLSNTWDELIIQHPTGVIIDAVAWDNGASFPDPTGASMMLIDPDLDNAIGSNWTTSALPMADGDMGTPGGVNNGVSGCSPAGEVTGDGAVNVADLVAIVGYITGSVVFDDQQLCQADVNQDSLINVVDLVLIVDYILSP